MVMLSPGCFGFLSTPSARRATAQLARASAAEAISIHALREEGDARPGQSRPNNPISIHALREEGDGHGLHGSDGRYAISIHALREEGDEFIDFILEALSNFYPRPPRGGRRIPPSGGATIVEFLSTPSARRATVHGLEKALSQKISIHALREEGDARRRLLRRCRTYFYPRPPRGGRRRRRQGDDHG